MLPIFVRYPLYWTLETVVAELIYKYPKFNLLNGIAKLILYECAGMIILVLIEYYQSP